MPRPRKASTKTDSNYGKIDAARAVMLRKRGATFQEIADIYGVTKQSAHGSIQRFLAELGQPEEIETFKAIETDVQEAIKLRYSRHLLTADLEKVSARDAAIVYGTIYDKNRLSTNQSTQNVAVKFATAVMDSDEE